MLSKKDFEKIRLLIREEIALSHTRTMVMEKGPKKQGDPEGKVVKEKQNINMLDFWTIYAPRIEGALRGMQEDVGKTKNRVAEQGEMVKAVGNILVGMESAALNLVEVSSLIAHLKENKQALIAPLVDAPGDPK